MRKFITVAFVLVVIGGAVYYQQTGTDQGESTDAPVEANNGTLWQEIAENVTGPCLNRMARVNAKASIAIERNPKYRAFVNGTFREARLLATHSERVGLYSGAYRGCVALVQIALTEVL